MYIHIEKAKFQQAHAVFLRHMQEQGDGVPFTGFGHRFFDSDEVSWTSPMHFAMGERHCDLTSGTNG